MSLLAPFLAHGAPAGGAPLEDLIPATIVGMAAVAGIVAVGYAHRRGRISWLGRIAQVSERVSGIPAWAALPGVITGVSLIVAVFGFYWDVSTHIDNGRDVGPFANPSHWFILLGLAGIALAGAVSVILGVGEDEVDSAVDLRSGWRVPVGGLLLLLCGVVALAGFPLDDVWHRLFGQDVTLWGPTHIQMVGGASLATLAQWALFVEAGRAPRLGRGSRSQEVLRRVRDLSLGGAFLIGLATLQAEFDYGVPQFRLLYQPVMVAVAAGAGLVAARIRVGRWGALAAAGFFLVIRVGLTLIIGVGLDRVLLSLPLFLPEAVLVEAIAVRVGRERQLTLGAWAGLAIGTVGLAAEWLWTQVAMPLPWNAALFPEVAVLGPLAGMAGGLIGAYVGRALAPPSVDRQTGPPWAAVATAVAAVLVLAWPLPMTAPQDIQATFELDEVASGDERAAQVTVHLDPADAADGAEWLTLTAWQGAEWTDEQSVVDRLQEVSPGVFRTTQPIPIHGNWKAMVRLHRGRLMAAAPLFMPEDQAIPAEEIPAVDGSTRSFVYGKTLLQREAKDVPQWYWNVGYGVLAIIVGGWIAAVVWGLRRLRLTRPDPRPPGRVSPESRPPIRV
ncbi:MAG: hypothetical protein KY437_05475 [Actinobacteria bacterium]|nr:hypothetical protein [Actinomycetota bacterium]